MIDAFFLGLATPLTAACALPLYPGFIAYLASQDGSTPAWQLALAVAAGLIAAVMTVGFVFTAVLETSLTRVVSVAGPTAHAGLLALGIALLFNRTPWARTNVAAPSGRTPLATAFLYGSFFAVIALPCNPAFIAYFFADLISQTAATALSRVSSVVSFATGMAAPLFVLALIPVDAAKAGTAWLARHESWVNRVSGAILVGIALYYLIAVFNVV